MPLMLKVIDMLVCACAGLLHFLNHAMVVEYVMLIVTKFGAIPLTSVPVILRNYRQMPVM